VSVSESTKRRGSGKERPPSAQGRRLIC